MGKRTPLPKTQEQISQDSIVPYVNPESGTAIGFKGPLNTVKKREHQISRKNDTEKNYSVGIRDIDEALYYYFNDVIKPTVMQNGKQIPIPVVYGSPERWSTMQKDGFYRDKNGKLQTPIIVYRRDSLEKDRTKGNKLDANNPHNFGVFEVKYSKKNMYDRFDLLNNRVPVKEYISTAIPDYVTVTYTCVIYTDFVEQSNRVIEAVNYASDSYWGLHDKFKFQARVDQYRTDLELTQGTDRVSKVTFTLTMRGYIITDALNAQIFNSQKFFSKSSVKVNAETVITNPK